MAFTLVHPAAVVPMARRGLILSALVVGSMAPDYPYYLQLSAGNRFGHSLPGIFLLSLPLGLIALWLFHVVMKRPLSLFLPLSVQRRLAGHLGKFAFWPACRFGMILLSLMLGIATHVAWDFVTHSFGWRGRGLSLMAMTLSETPLGPLRLCDALHLGTSALGGMLLCVWSYRWYVRAPVRECGACPAVITPVLPLALGGVAFLVATAAGLVAGGGLSGTVQARACIMKAVVVGIAALCIEAVAFSLFVRVALRSGCDATVGPAGTADSTVIPHPKRSIRPQRLVFHGGCSDSCG